MRTKKAIAIFERGDIVVVPFPFTDSATQKVRPALVLSRSGAYSQTGQIICAMVTGAKKSTWPLDTPIAHWKKAGLTIPSVVRMKLFTIDVELVARKVGALDDQAMSDVDEVVVRLLT
jgi:mRNA interferase MazF